MSAKKNRSRNASTVRKGSRRKNVKDKTPVKKIAVASPAHVKAKVTSFKQRTSVQSNPMMLQAEFSTILKEPGDDLQDDIEDSFNPPLHSTALDDDDSPEKTKVPNEVLAKQASPHPSVSLQKSVRGKSSARKIKNVVSNKPNSTALKGNLEKALQTGQKITPSAEKSSKVSSFFETAKEQATSSKSSSHAAPDRNKSPPGNIKPAISKKSIPNKKKSKKADGKDIMQVKIWSSDDLPRTARDINELDVILFECEKLVEMFRESTDNDASKNAVDEFFRSFKDQLTNTMKNIQMLLNLKRNNAKMQLVIGRKQKRLIEVRDEIIKKQPRLNQLQKEFSEEEERQKCLNEAEVFLGNLQQLKEDYRIFKAENPRIKETYGLSSLPACLIEARTTLMAEQQFHNVNTQLQSFLDKMTEER